MFLPVYGLYKTNLILLNALCEEKRPTLKRLAHIVLIFCNHHIPLRAFSPYMCYDDYHLKNARLGTPRTRRNDTLWLYCYWVAYVVICTTRHASYTLYDPHALALVYTYLCIYVYIVQCLICVHIFVLVYWFSKR